MKALATGTTCLVLSLAAAGCGRDRANREAAPDRQTNKSDTPAINVTPDQGTANDDMANRGASNHGATHDDTANKDTSGARAPHDDTANKDTVNKGNERMRPASRTATPSEALVDARCAREQRCGNVGDQKRFASAAECVERVSDDWQAQLKDRQCTSGSGAPGLDRCVSELRNWACNRDVTEALQQSACGLSELCGTGSGPKPSTGSGSQRSNPGSPPNEH